MIDKPQPQDSLLCELCDCADPTSISDLSDDCDCRCHRPEVEDELNKEDN